MALLSLAACNRPRVEVAFDPVSVSAAETTADISDTDLVRHEHRHDFGLVLTGSRPRHAFRVENTSQVPWTIKTIRLSCACTVPRISGQVIHPGSAETVDVEFIAGQQTADIVKTVTVVFAEPDVSPIALDVTAQVRAPLNIVPDEIVTEMGPGESGSGEFSVSNFTAEDWPGIEVVPTEAWISCTVKRLPSAKTLQAHPRQQWHVQFQTDGERLGLGRHSARFQIRATTDANLVRTVLVEARVRSPILIIPSELFFGTVASGSSVTKKVSVRVREKTAIATDLQPTDIVHDLGEELDVRWTKLDDGTSPLWEIQATLTPRPRTSAENIVRAKITITFPATRGLPTLTIPVLALVSIEEPP